MSRGRKRFVMDTPGFHVGQENGQWHAGVRLTEEEHGQGRAFSRRGDSRAHAIQQLRWFLEGEADAFGTALEVLNDVATHEEPS